MANFGYWLQAPGTLQVQNGDYLASQNGDYFAVIQSDGNLCVYPGTYPATTPNAIWCSLSASQCLAVYFATLQDDGNLCVYSGIGGTPPFLANPGSIWCSGSNQPNPPVQCYLILEGDGDLNVYQGTPESPGSLLWGSRHPPAAAESASSEGAASDAAA